MHHCVAFPGNIRVAEGWIAAGMCHLSELLITRWSLFQQKDGFLGKGMGTEPDLDVCEELAVSLYAIFSNKPR